MTTYLITGIAGFIGSALARAVLAQGDKVRGVDNFSTGRPENLDGIRDLIDFRETDILDLDAMNHACCGVDYVLHQAAIASVPKSVLEPLGNNRTNVDGTLNVLVAARDARVKRVVYAASSSAYGDSPIQPKQEDMSPDPISPYAVSKLAGEYYMVSFYRCYRLETVCLRTSTFLAHARIPRLRTPVSWPSSLARCCRESDRPYSAMGKPAATLPTSMMRCGPTC